MIELADGHQTSASRAIAPVNLRTGGHRLTFVNRVGGANLKRLTFETLQTVGFGVGIQVNRHSVVIQ
jgi:hypothetical protein